MILQDRQREIDVDLGLLPTLEELTSIRQADCMFNVRVTDLGSGCMKVLGDIGTMQQVIVGRSIAISQYFYGISLDQRMHCLPCYIVFGFSGHSRFLACVRFAWDHYIITKGSVVPSKSASDIAGKVLICMLSCQTSRCWFMFHECILPWCLQVQQHMQVVMSRRHVVRWPDHWAPQSSVVEVFNVLLDSDEAKPLLAAMQGEGQVVQVCSCT